MAEVIPRVQAALRAATSPSERPTQVQILDIAKLTHLADSNKEIQEMIHRRLQSTEFYKPQETFHTLLLVQKCLPVASKDFVDFCVKRIHLVVALTHYERGDNPTDREMDKLVRDRAKAVAKLLLDPSELAQKRRIVSFAPSSVTSSAMPASSRRRTAVPLRSILANGFLPKDHGQTGSLANAPEPNRTAPKPPEQAGSSTARFKPTRSLPTPPPSSPENSKKASLRAQVPGGHGSPPRIDKPSVELFSNIASSPNVISYQVPPIDHDTHKNLQSILSLKAKVVAKMTFTRAGLDAVLREFEDYLEPKASKGVDLDLILPALELVCYCLFRGSDAFVAHCQDIRATFHIWSQRHDVHENVRSVAKVIDTMLEDSSRLQQERRRMTSPNSTSRQAISGSSFAATSGPSKPPPPDDIKGAAIPRSPPPGAPEVAGEHSNSADRQPRIQSPHKAPENQQKDSPVRKSAAASTIYISLLGARPAFSSVSSDIWKGEYKSAFGKETVAIKIFRWPSKFPVEILYEYLDDMLTPWRSLVHNNISPLYGLYLDPEDNVGLASPFYDKGNVIEYMKVTPGVDPLIMMKGIAAGLSFLHAQQIVHGNLKGNNIMISAAGVPKLIDFGLVQAMEKFAEQSAFLAYNNTFPFRWSAPELLFGEPEDSVRTYKSDIYAFASTCVEIMTRQCPYYGESKTQVLKKILRGQLPDRPLADDGNWDPCDELWIFLTTCWSALPRDRPDIVTMKRKLSEFYT